MKLKDLKEKAGIVFIFVEDVNDKGDIPVYKMFETDAGSEQIAYFNTNDGINYCLWEDDMLAQREIKILKF